MILYGLVLSMNFANADQNLARVGQEFTLKVGQQVKFEGTDLLVKFVAVPQDSRCPSNVNCVWAGNAEVAVDLLRDKCTTILTLNTHPRPAASDEGKVGDLRIKLVKLEPYPHTERKISPSDYTATFVVTKE
jgi:hypothetical protein